MRYLPLATASLVALALTACKPSTTTADSTPMLSAPPAPIIPHAPSAPVVPPDPPQPEPPADGVQQTLRFVGPMDLAISLSTDDNFATAVMTDNSDRTLEMYSVPSASGVKLEDGEGATIHFKNGEGYVEFSPGNSIDIKEFRLP